MNASLDTQKHIILESLGFLFMSLKDSGILSKHWKEYTRDMN